MAVTGDATYTAVYAATPIFGTPAFTLPAAIKAIGESAFEGLPMTIVEIPSGCESIGKWAFRGCTGLTQIRIPASVTAIDDAAFDGCANVYVFGAADSAAEIFCDAHANCTFVAKKKHVNDIPTHTGAAPSMGRPRCMPGCGTGA